MPRLKSRKTFVKCTEPINTTAKAARENDSSDWTPVCTGRITYRKEEERTTGNRVPGKMCQRDMETTGVRAGEKMDRAGPTQKEDLQLRRRPYRRQEKPVERRIYNRPTIAARVQYNIVPIRFLTSSEDLHLLKCFFTICIVCTLTSVLTNTSQLAQRIPGQPGRHSTGCAHRLAGQE